MIGGSSLTVIFDIRENGGFEWISLLVTCLPGIGGLLFAVAPTRLLPLHFTVRAVNLVRIWFGIIVFAFSGFITIANEQQYYSQRAELLRAYQAGQYEIVEGVRNNFVPTPDGHGEQSFDVAGRHFSFWESFRSPAFHGNHILWDTNRKSLFVRMFVVGNNIIHVEVAS